MLLKYPTIFANARSLLSFVDEFARPRLISQTSIMLFLENTSIKVYWYRSKKMLFLYPCASLDQILMKMLHKVLVTWLKTIVGNNIFIQDFIFKYNKNWIVCSYHATNPFQSESTFYGSLNVKNSWLEAGAKYQV